MKAHMGMAMNVKEPQHSSCRGPGRPPEMAECERRKRILSAADEALRRYGYQAVSMDKVAQCSGMSKRTLYQLFPSKQDLFQSLIEKRLFCFSLSIREHALTSEDELIGLLDDLAAHLTRPETIELIRAIIASASEAEDLRDIMNSLKQCGKSNVLQAWLHAYCIQHGHPETRIDLKAQQLFSLTAGERMLHALFNKETDAEDSRACIADGARLFLAGLHAEWSEASCSTLNDVNSER